MPGALRREGEDGAFAVAGNDAVVGDPAGGVQAPRDGSGVGSGGVVEDDMSRLDDAAF